MRKIFSKTAILLALALLFAGCQKPHLLPSIPDTAAWDEELQCFQFPGTRWGMTQEEWIEAWNLSEEDYEALSDDPYQINGNDQLSGMSAPGCLGISGEDSRHLLRL